MWIFSRLWRSFISKCRKLKWRCQRFIRGWADEDTWDIEGWFIEILLPMLKNSKRTITVIHLNFLEKNGTKLLMI